MKLVDTHCHIQTEDFASDVGAVLERAQEHGVERMIVVGGAGDLSTNDAAIELADRYPHLHATVGMHPHDAKELRDTDMDHLTTLTAHPKVVAVGETGLDFYYNHSPRQLQMETFARFIDLALQTRLPIVVHNRDSDREVADLLRRHGKGALRGVIHCFTGDAGAARIFLDLGFLLSFSGIVTFKNAAALREVAHWVPLERMLIETDAPFLAPVPYRGRRNEPAYVRFVAQTIAEVRGIDIAEVAEATTRNALEFFGIQ